MEDPVAAHTDDPPSFIDRLIESTDVSLVLRGRRTVLVAVVLSDDATVRPCEIEPADRPSPARPKLETAYRFRDSGTAEKEPESRLHRRFDSEADLCRGGARLYGSASCAARDRFRQFRDGGVWPDVMGIKHARIEHEMVAHDDERLQVENL